MLKPMETQNVDPLHVQKHPFITLGGMYHMPASNLYGPL